jgi:hypothetical protein
MKLEEIVTKLEQIEQQASLTISEYPHGLTVERQRLIVGLARQLRMHVRDQLRQGKRAPDLKEPVRVHALDESSHLHAVPGGRTASNTE